MASYNQNINIDLNVDTSTVQTQLAAAAGEITGVQESLEAVDSDFTSATDSLELFSEIASRDLTPELDTSSIEEETNKIHELAESLEIVEEAKDAVADSNKALSDKNVKTSETTDGEAASFETLMKSASSLSDAKDAVTKSNAALDDQTGKSKREVLEESINMDVLRDAGLDLEQLIDSLVGSQEDLEDQADTSSDAIDVETDSFETMIDSADSLEEAKYAVANANKHIQNESGKSTDELIREKVEMGELDEEALKLIDTNDGLSDSSKRARKSLQKLRETTDRSTSTMKAAADASDLFEDGLGALSINIGAFTIALRNFLTQIPLLITGLGSIAAAATGGASAFISLAGAMTGLVGAGFIAYAQTLVKEVSEIEDIGQALRVIFSALVDLFEKAAAPLLKLGDVSFYFRFAAEAAADAINILSNAILELTVGSEQLQEFAKSAGVELYTINDAIADLDGSSWRNITEALMKAWVLLGDEVVTVLGMLNNAIARSITRSAELLNEVENLSGAFSQFSETISQLTELGFTIGSALLPVFELFSSVVGDVAAFINNLDDEVVAGIITLAAFSAITSKVAGSLASVVNIGPNVVGSVMRIASNAREADSTFGKLRKTVEGTATTLGSFMKNIGAFGGVSSLIESVTSLDDANRAVALSTDRSNAVFKALALNTDMTGDQIKDLAVQGKLTADQMDYLTDNLEEMDEGLRDVLLSSKLTDEELEELEDNKIPQITPEGDLIKPGDIDDSAEDVLLSIDKINNAPIGPKPKKMNQFQKAFDNLSGSYQKVATQAGAATVPTSLYSAATQALSWSAIKATFSQQGLVAALKLAKTQLLTAAVQSVAYIASLFGITSGALSAAGATLVLKQAMDVATLGLTKIISGVIVLITVLGGLAYGAAKNSDQIVSAFKGAVNVLKGIFGAIGSFLMSIFSATWDAIKMIIDPVVESFEPLFAAFSKTGDAASETGGIIETISTLFKLFTERTAFLIRGIGALGKILLTVFLTPLRLTMSLLGLVIDGIQLLTSAVTNFITNSAPFKALFGDAASEGDGLIDVINILLDQTLGRLKDFEKGVEDFINSIINDINDMIESINDLSFAGLSPDISTIGEVKLTEEDRTDTETADVRAQKDAQLNYTVDKSTNIDQTVNADPEDKGQISRIAKDAIREANSFGRRTQGSQ